MLSTIRHGEGSLFFTSEIQVKKLVGIRMTWSGNETQLEQSGNETRNVARWGTYWESQVGKPGIAKLFSVFLEKTGEEVLSTSSSRDNLLKSTYMEA